MVIKCAVSQCSFGQEGFQMPYVFRDNDGKIIRVTTRQTHGAELVAYDNPELAAFVNNNGQDQKQLEEAFSELRRTDYEMSRAVEDVIVALLRKNILKLTDLPKEVQDRMAWRTKMRMAIQKVYDDASGHYDDPLRPIFPSSDLQS